MDNKKTEAIPAKEKAGKNEEEKPLELEIFDEVQNENREKDCRDNCMHCGFHCKYLKD